LLQRVGAEAAAGGDRSVDVVGIRAGECKMYSRANGGPIRLLADKFDRHPMVVVAGVLKKDIAIPIAGSCAAELHVEVDVAVPIPIPGRHGVPFLEMPRSR